MFGAWLYNLFLDFTKFCLNGTSHSIFMVVEVASEIVGDYLDKGREEELVEEKVLLKRSQVMHICVCSVSAVRAGAGHCDQGEWTQLLFHCWIYQVGT